LITLVPSTCQEQATPIQSGEEQRLTIVRPDDWHLHARDDATLKAVIPHTAKVFGRAIIMPNLVPPITTVDQVIFLF
jgi:dihydroorotase